MSPHEHRIGVGVLVHRCLQTFRQVLLVWGVLNDRDAQSVVVVQVALALATRNTLDLLDVAHLEACFRAHLPFNQQGDQDCPLRVSVNTTASTLLKGREEQRGAGGWLQCEGLADIVAVFGGVFLGGPLDDEDVVGLDQFLLDTGGRKEDVIAMAN